MNIVVLKKLSNILTGWVSLRIYLFIICDYTGQSMFFFFLILITAWKDRKNFTVQYCHFQWSRRKTITQKIIEEFSLFAGMSLHYEIITMSINKKLFYWALICKRSFLLSVIPGDEYRETNTDNKVDMRNLLVYAK